MSNEVIVALIASLVGGVLVAIINFLFVRNKTIVEVEKMKVEIERARFESEFEVRKLRQEFQQVFTNVLLERRLEVYPSLYAVLSTFTKNVRNTESVSKADVRELFAQMSEWNAKNQIYLGIYTNELEYRFRDRLLKLLRKDDDAFLQEFVTDDPKKEIIRSADTLKLALKHELGVYLIENPAVEIPQRLKSFKEIAVIFEKEWES